MEPSKQKLLIALGVVLVLLVFYIIARVKSKKGELVMSANGWDVAMLLVTPLAIFIAWFWGFDHPLNPVQTVCMVVAGFCFCGTCIMSAIHNSDSPGNVLISILAKVFIVWLTLMLLMLILLVVVLSILLAMIHRDEDEYIVLRYDRVLRAYVGYRVYA